MGPQIPFTQRLANMLESEAAGMQASLEQTRQEFSQGGLKGDSGEKIVRKRLKKYLPRKYGFANGQIIDSHGKQSKEVDIAICNEGHPFTYEEEGQGVLFIEGVDCCIEVKSTLNQHHLKTAILNCQSVRELQPEIPTGSMRMRSEGEDRMQMVPYALFAFESDYNPRGLIEKIEELNEELHVNQRNTIDLIYMLDTGLVYNYRHDKPQNDGSETGYSEIRTEPQLLMFLVYLSRLMPTIQSTGNVLDSYCRPDKY